MTWLKRLLFGSAAFYIGRKINTARNNHREWTSGNQKPRYKSRRA